MSRSATVAFGLDFSGFSREGGSILAACVLGPGSTGRVEILESPVLGASRGGQERFDGWLIKQRQLVLRCLEVGRLAVDIPIDLQGLPFPTEAEAAWQLTLRPVDRATKALPALASFLGAPVARFLHLLPDAQKLIADCLFETYPAATFTFLPATKKLAKSSDRIHYKGTKKRKDGTDPAEIRRQLLSALRIAPQVEADLGDDRIDAAVCAVTACFQAGWLHGQRLKQRLMESNAWPGGQEALALPKGYLLLESFPAYDLPLIVRTAASFKEACAWVDDLKRA